MERFLRSWRQDALNRGQHDSAIYIGDKVLALTSKDYKHDTLIGTSDTDLPVKTVTPTRFGWLKYIFRITTSRAP
jgi:hypothetical protein